MELWVISTQQSFAEHTVRRFHEEAPALGIRLRNFKPGELDCTAGQEGYELRFQGQLLTPPQVLLVRTGASTITFHTLAVMKMLELQGTTRVINSFSTYVKARDKFLSLLHLAALGIPVPKTRLITTNYNAQQLADEFEFPVVVKEVTGARGNSVAFCHSIEQLDELLQMLFTIRKPEAEFILQQAIRTSIGRDLRNYVVGDQILGTIERRAKGQGRKANVSLGGEVRQVELTDEIADIVRKVQAAVGLEIGGIDLLYDEAGYQVCEVNLSAQFIGFEKATKLNVAQAILAYSMSKTQ